MEKKDLTIVYYTANKEKPEFEKKIIDSLIKNSGGLPIISVSQKPIDLGTNICVGELPWCDKSAFKQLLTGLKEVKTTFAIAAESDVIYPPEYFTFTPPLINEAYRYDNIWILHNWIGPGTKGMYWKKAYSEGAQMCGVKHWIEKLEFNIDQFKTKKGGSGIQTPSVFKSQKKFSWGSENPVISFKTIGGLRKYCGTIKDNPPQKELPYWGDATKLREQFFSN